MASVKQGTLTSATEWWKHLRPFGKRAFWKRERRAQAMDIGKQRADAGCEKPGGQGRTHQGCTAP